MLGVPIPIPLFRAQSIGWPHIVAPVEGPHHLEKEWFSWPYDVINEV